jgi:hypothetical protein
MQLVRFKHHHMNILCMQRDENMHDSQFREKLKIQEQLQIKLVVCQYWNYLVDINNSTTELDN